MRIQTTRHGIERVQYVIAAAIPLLVIAIYGGMIARRRGFNDFGFSVITYLTLLLLLVSAWWVLRRRASLLSGNLKVKLLLIVLLFVITIPATEVSSMDMTTMTIPPNELYVDNDVRFGTPIPFLM